MPRTKKSRPIPQLEPHRAPLNRPTGEVLTLAEAAAYLRVPEEVVVRMIRTQGLPGRQLDQEWRFLRAALQNWLGSVPVLPSNQAVWETHFGALRDDPFLEEMLGETYKRRGRPETQLV